MHIFLAYMIPLVVVSVAAMIMLNWQKPSVDVEIKDVKQGDTIWWIYRGKKYHAEVEAIDYYNDCYVYAYYDEYDGVCPDIISMQDIIKIKRKK